VGCPRGRGSGLGAQRTPFDPRNLTLSPVGTTSLTFADGNNAAFSYTIGGVTQTKQVTRFIFVAPGTLCR